MTTTTISRPLPKLTYCIMCFSTPETVTHILHILFPQHTADTIFITAL